MKRYRKALRRELRRAYVALDDEPGPYGKNEYHRTTGRYYGLRRAYAIVTGLPEDVIGQQVTSWYVQSEHYAAYQARKAGNQED